MVQKRILTRLKKLIAEKTGRQQKEITLGLKFNEDLHLNRLRLFLIIQDLEEELGIRISGEVFQKIRTVRQALQALEALPQEGGP